MDKTVIENKLLEIGVPVSLKGFKFISDAIWLLDKPEWKNPKWTSLYYAVGRLNDESATCVEKAIRTALQATRVKGDYDLVAEYIGFINCENSNSLMMLHNRLATEKCDEKIENIRELLLKLLIHDGA